MPDPTDDINFKKSLQNERNYNQRRNQIIAGIIISIVLFGALAYFIYQKNTQSKIQPEVLPNTSLSYLNKSNYEVGTNINSSFSTSVKTEIDPQTGNSSQANNSKSQSLFYTGKIDDKIPFRVKLDYNDVGTGNIQYTGLEIYEGLSKHTLAIKARTVNNATPDYCPEGKCNFNIQEYDSPETDADKILALDKPLGEFQGNFDINDTKMNKVLGTWTKADKSQKLKFELNRSEEFEIEDYVIVYNQDKSLYLDGEGCKSGYSKIINADCYIKNFKTKQKLAKIRTCEGSDKSCWSEILMGKLIQNKQYFYTKYGVGCQNNLNIDYLDLRDNQIRRQGSYEYYECSDYPRLSDCENDLLVTKPKLCSEKNCNQINSIVPLLRKCFESDENYNNYKENFNRNKQYLDALNKYSLPKS